MNTPDTWENDRAVINDRVCTIARSNADWEWKVVGDREVISGICPTKQRARDEATEYASTGKVTKPSDAHSQECLQASPRDGLVFILIPLPWALEPLVLEPAQVRKVCEMLTAAADHAESQTARRN